MKSTHVARTSASTTAPRTTGAAESREPGFGLGGVIAAVIPLLLLAGLVLAFLTWGGLLTGPAPVPADALARIDIERLAFRPGEIRASIINSGPVDVTIAQVFVNDAIWDFSIEPDATISRLGRAHLTMPFPWLEAEPHKVGIVLSNGLRFEKEVAIASETPGVSASYVSRFALLGLYAGVIPVLLGLLWWPLLRRLSQSWMGFLISLTAGVLLFLGVDLLKEALDLTGEVPGPFRGVALIVIGVAVGGLGLLAIGRRTMGAGANRNETHAQLVLAYMIAVGIGLHNFGEGLAIGSAYVLGEVALGALLIVGFTVHNATEGIAIVGPVARRRVSVLHLVALGLIAGGPTVVGTLIGGFSYSVILATLFLALGAGAIFYVLFELSKILTREQPVGTSGANSSIMNFVGLLAGLVLMYVTGLLISA